MKKPIYKRVISGILVASMIASGLLLSAGCGTNNTPSVTAPSSEISEPRQIDLSNLKKEETVEKDETADKKLENDISNEDAVKQALEKTFSEEFQIEMEQDGVNMLMQFNSKRKFMDIRMEYNENAFEFAAAGMSDNKNKVYVILEVKDPDNGTVNTSKQLGIVDNDEENGLNIDTMEGEYTDGVLDIDTDMYDITKKVDGEYEVFELNKKDTEDEFKAESILYVKDGYVVKMIGFEKSPVAFVEDAEEQAETEIKQVEMIVKHDNIDYTRFNDSDFEEVESDDILMSIMFGMFALAMGSEDSQLNFSTDDSQLNFGIEE